MMIIVIIIHKTFYGYSAGQPVVASTALAIENWSILWEKSFTGHMLLLPATGAFRLED